MKPFWERNILFQGVPESLSSQTWPPCKHAQWPWRVITASPVGIKPYFLVGKLVRSLNFLGCGVDMSDMDAEGSRTDTFLVETYSSIRLLAVAG